jgi:hypothetical protein
LPNNDLMGLRDVPASSPWNFPSAMNAALERQAVRPVHIEDPVAVAGDEAAHE